MSSNSLFILVCLVRVLAVGCAMELLGVLDGFLSYRVYFFFFVGAVLSLLCSFGVIEV